MQSLRDLGYLPYFAAYKHIFPPGILSLHGANLVKIILIMAAG
jgi:hypothetical protein